MALLENDLARRANGQVELRPTPLRVEFLLTDLLTADSQLTCRFACSIATRSTPADQQLLEEVLLCSRPTVTAASVAEHFAPQLRAAAEQATRKQTTAAWLEGAQEPIVAALRSAATAVAFSSGIDVLPPFQIDLDSPAYRRQRFETMERDAVERRAADRVTHLQRAGELLKQFESLRATMPGVPAGAVLEQVSPADRGALLQTLLQGAGRETAARPLWVVAGNGLVKIDCAAASNAGAAFSPLPDDLGPLRSVHAVADSGKPILLIGAQRGVWRLSPDKPGAPQAFLHPTVAAPVGFNRAVLLEDEIWATHGEAGIVAWRLDSPSVPWIVVNPTRDRAADPSTTAGPTGYRHLCKIDEHRALVADGSRLLTVNREGNLMRVELPAKGEISAILAAGSRLVVVSGPSAEAFEPLTLQPLQSVPLPGNIRAAAALPWLGEDRLLVVGDGAVECVGLDDSLVTRYSSGYRGMRMLAASSFHVAGVTEDRLRVIVWNAWDGRQPVRDIYVTGLAKHRVTDLAFG